MMISRQYQHKCYLETLAKKAFLFIFYKVGEIVCFRKYKFKFVYSKPQLHFNLVPLIKFLVMGDLLICCPGLLAYINIIVYF